MKAIDFIKKRYKEEYKTESAKRFIELVDYSKLAGIMEEYAEERLRLYKVGVTFKEKEIPTFVDWWIDEGYYPTERPNVFKNGCNLVLLKDLESKYKKEFNIKP
jgi:hypothetical protein